MEEGRSPLNQSLPFIPVTTAQVIPEILEFPLSSYYHHMILADVITGQRKRRGGALVKTNRDGQRPVSRPAWLLAEKGGFCPCLPGDTMSQEWLSGPRERLLSSGRCMHISRGQEALAPESPL